MMKLTVVGFLLLASCLVVTGAPPPQGCSEVTNTYFDKQGLYPITISATFSVDADPNFVVVSNISIDCCSNAFYKSVCAVPEDGEILCVTDFTKSIKFPVQNETGTSLFNIVANVNNSLTSDLLDQYYLFYTVFDEGYFSMDTGEVFSDINQCFGGAYYDRHGKLKSSVKHCCTAFKPIQAAPKNVTTCRKFKSRTTIYNTDDNYSIFATSQVNYTLWGQNMTIHGESANPDEIKIWVLFNQDGGSCYIPQEANRTCSFAIPDGDSRFLINTAYENKTIPIDWNSITQDKTVPVGRLIIRNNVPMIMDADPHVPENNCQYYSLPFGPNQVVTSSFCCTEF